MIRSRSIDGLCPLPMCFLQLACRDSIPCHQRHVNLWLTISSNCLNESELRVTVDIRHVEAQSLQPFSDVVNRRKSAGCLANDQSTIEHQRAGRFAQVVARIRSHQGQRKHGNVNLDIVKRHTFPDVAPHQLIGNGNYGRCGRAVLPDRIDFSNLVRAIRSQWSTALP